MNKIITRAKAIASGYPWSWFWDAIDLDSPRLTRAYAGGLALLVLALFVPQLPPMVDYPQHLAVADVARRLMLPDSIAHQHFSSNWFTYNALFHLLTSLLSFILPTELAGRVVVAGGLVGLAVGTVSLLRSLKRPPLYAALLVPTFFSFSLAWGFINYALGVTLVVVTTAQVAYNIQTPSWTRAWAILLLGVLTGFTHVLAALVLCCFATSLTPEVAWAAAKANAPGASPWVLARIAVRRALVALLPLSAGALYCVLVFFSQYRENPGSYQDATLEGRAPPLWAKVLQFGGYATGVHLDQSDTILVWVSILVMGWAVHSNYRHRAWPSALGPLGPFLAMLTAYFALPEVFIGTHLVFPRLAQLTLIATALMLPPLAAAARERVESAGRVIAWTAGANLLIHSIWHAIETDGASQVLAALPPGRRATAVLYDPTSRAFQCATLVHLAAYYGARQGGEWAYNFARFSSVPLSFEHGEPSWPQLGWEFAPGNYNPRCGYARSYDLVVVAAPRTMSQATEDDVRKLIFKADALLPRLLAHSGRYYAFDTAGIPADGTP